MSFQPTHTLRQTFSTGLTADFDVQLILHDPTDTTNGHAYDKATAGTNTCHWELRNGRWLYDGSDHVGGEPLDITVMPYGEKVTFRLDDPNAFRRIAAAFDANNARRGALATAAEVDPDLPLTAEGQEVVAALAGHWRSEDPNRLPVIVDMTVRVVDATKGSLDVEARVPGYPTDRTPYKAFEAQGSRVKVQKRDAMQLSTWHLADANTLVCGDPAYAESLMTFRRQATAPDGSTEGGKGSVGAAALVGMLLGSFALNNLFIGAGMAVLFGYLASKMGGAS